MITIKNFEGFKKSLLTATNGTMEETFDSSVLFSGNEYHSYRVYVDAIHYYNMFIIHNFATNTYDVALETACCGTCTMSRKIKTQKSLIESVVAWISCNYLNTKKIDSDSEECTDMCEETNENENAECAKGNDVFKGCKTVKDVMKARSNLEWHHVSLKTLANIDFDMLDEKRKLVFDINQILKDGIRNLYKCENHISFEVLERYVIRKCDELIRRNRLKAFWFSYIARQLDEVRRNTIYLYTPYITAHRNRW